MKTSEMLRALAGDLRVEASRRDVERRTKAAGLISAATGLAMLRAKLEGRHA